MKKVYLPLLLVCVIAMVLYAILPTKFTLEESESLQVSKDIWYLHNFSPEYFGTLIYHILGWKDWYVFCIIIFYSFFYLSQYLSRKNPQNQTWIMCLLTGILGRQRHTGIATVGHSSLVTYMERWCRVGKQTDGMSSCWQSCCPLSFWSQDL